MISITHLGNESQLSSQYPAIEEFYHNHLKLHRISVTDRLFLSVLELPAPEPTAPGNSTQDALASNAANLATPGTSATSGQAGSTQFTDTYVPASSISSATASANSAADSAALNAPSNTFENADEKPEAPPIVPPVDFVLPEPPDSSKQTATFSNADIKSFWTQTNSEHDDTNTLVIVPGRAENEHKYAELLYNLRDSGLRVVVCFVRGQGQSSNVIYGSTKCHVEYFANYRHDLETMLNYLNIGPNYKLMGFSLGGLISLDFCFFGTYPYKPKALGLISPFLGVHYPIPPALLYWTIAGLCLFRGFALAYTPHGKEYKRIPFEENYHSHCKVRYNLYHDYYASHPQQAIAGPSFNFVKCCLRAQRKLHGAQIKFNFPVICLSSVEDKVVNFKQAQEFFELHQNDPVPPIFEAIPGAFHDVLNESDKYRNQTLAKVLNFLFPGSVNLVDPKAELAAKAAAEQAELEKRMSQPLDMAEELAFDDDELEPAADNAASK